MVWLPSQLAARLYTGLEQRLLGEEEVAGGEAQATGGVPEWRMQGMIGRKWREKEGDLDEETSIAKKKEEEREGGRVQDILFI
jgi:hypothetical protein